jgi:hypothetical protein
LKKILRVDLKDDYCKRFEEIKEKNKYESDAALVRALIDQYKLALDQIRIGTEILDKIRQEIQNPMVRLKYGIFHVDDFVLRALINFFEKIKSERGSLLEWDVRSQLSETQREIAIAFFELQTKNPSGITKSQIADFLNKKEEELESDIVFLSKSGLLERHGNLFYAP